MGFSERTDVFAAASNPTMGRIIDYLAMTNADELDELVTFIADAINAFYQVSEAEVFYMEPLREWKAWRRSKGLDAEGVVWRLLKQLPGRRAAGARWGDHVCSKFESIAVRQLPAQPYFSAKEGTRIVLESHMDDFHGVGRRSEIEPFLEQMRNLFKLKASDLILGGEYSHLKRIRWKFFTLRDSPPAHEGAGLLFCC